MNQLIAAFLKPDAGLARSRSALLLGLALFGGLPATAQAQAYPSRAIDVIVPAPAATPIDFVARVLEPVMSASLGQPLVVQNVAGAGGTIGLAKLARAPKDGYTIGIVAVPLVITPALYKLPYDAAHDIVPVSILTRGDLALVVNDKVPAKDLQAFIARAKASGNAATYGSPGVGSGGHLLFEMFKAKTGAPVLHVPYKGSSPVTTALISGEIDSAILSISQAVPLAKDGRVRILGVLSDARLPSLPDVPTLDEQGIKGMDMNTWIAMIAPAGLPKAVLERLNTEAVKALNNEKVRKTLQDAGSEIAGSSLADASKTVATDMARYSEVIQKLGIKVE